MLVLGIKNWGIYIIAPSRCPFCCPNPEGEEKCGRAFLPPNPQGGIKRNSVKVIESDL